MSAGPVNTLKITVQRKFAAGWPIVVEYSRADVLLPTRSEGSSRVRRGVCSGVEEPARTAEGVWGPAWQSVV